MEFNSSFELHKEPLSEKVASLLRKQILSNKIKVDEHLSEVELAKRLNVSRGPVREAIRQLEHEGLVYTPANGRTLAIGFNETDLHDLFEVRQMIESKAIVLIIKNGNLDILDELDAIVERSRNTKSLSLLIELDVLYHEKLVKLSANRTLVKVWAVLRGLINTLIEMTSDIYQKIDQVPDIHQDILTAIRGGATEQATALLIEHLQTGEAVILAAYQRGTDHVEV